MPLNSEANSNVTTCSNCHTPMPRELRFCRNCGFRLGEGLAEYTETVRFQSGRPGTVAANTATTSQQPFETSHSFSGGPLAATGDRQIRKRSRRMSGMTWMFLSLLIFFIAAGAFTAIITPIRRSINSGIRVGIVKSATRSYVGVNSFDSTDGGVTFDDVEPPGSPADKAGLVGGDVITTFDGQVVDDDDQIMDRLGQIPVGKTVDVVFIRDGETKTTKITTISKEELDRLAREFSQRPEGKGQFGYDDDSATRVTVPGTKMFGVRLDQILQNRAADLAGIKKGDIVTEFNGAPIRTPEEFHARVLRALPYSTVEVVVLRGTELLKIPVKIGKQ